MADRSSPDSSDDEDLESDGGVQTAEYLDEQINLFSPATPFMADHLRLMAVLFGLWVLFVFGPVTAAVFAPEFMTETIVLGFQLHFLLTAIVAPLGALVLSVIYAWRRDRLDEKYGISHDEPTGERVTEPAASGGEE